MTGPRRPLPRHADRPRRRGQRIVGRGRFSIPVSDKPVDVAIRFDAQAIARFKRDAGANLIVDAQFPNGSVGAGADGRLGLEVG